MFLINTKLKLDKICGGQTELRSGWSTISCWVCWDGGSSAEQLSIQAQHAGDSWNVVTFDLTGLAQIVYPLRLIKTCKTRKRLSNRHLCALSTHSFTSTNMTRNMLQGRTRPNVNGLEVFIIIAKPRNACRSDINIFLILSAASNSYCNWRCICFEMDNTELLYFFCHDTKLQISYILW